MGRIGVLAVSSTPRVEFHTYAKGWAAGTAKGSAYGIAEGLLNSLSEFSRNPPHDPYAAMGFLVGAIVLTTFQTVFQGVAGGIEAVPGKTAVEIEEQLKASVGGVDLANDLAKTVHDVSVSRPEINEHGIQHLGSSVSEAHPAYDHFSKQGVDTIVEVRILEAGFRGGSGTQPIVRFYMNARIRLITPNSGIERYTRDFQFMSREHPFAEWFFDGSRELVSGFRQAVRDLADRIVDEVFLVTNFPFDSGLWALPGRPEYGACWFRPVYPELKYSSFWHSVSRNAPGIQVLFTEVDSVQPLLRWEEFPRPRDRNKGNLPVLNAISDVTYDLKIWEAIDDFAERLVYDKTGLLEPQHRPAVPLKPGTKYFWTFRARYQLGGKSQVTRWAFSNIPLNVPAEYPVRKPGGSCDLDAIPNTNYYRFATPAK